MKGDKNSGGQSGPKTGTGEDRAARRAEALRANLARRKAQARARRAETPPVTTDGVPREQINPGTRPEGEQ